MAGSGSAALGRGRVAGAHRDRRFVDVLAEAFCGQGDPGERRPQVLLDVHGERTERRHVQHPAPALGRGRGLGHQPVERPEERGERLARAGGREDQRVAALGDRGPALLLGRRRRIERRPEPGADGGEKRSRLRLHGIAKTGHGLTGKPSGRREGAGRMRTVRYPREHRPRSWARSSCRSRPRRRADRRDRGGAPDQIVLSGDVSVRRGEEAGQVVVLHGTATVAGIARGDVVVIDGRILVTGQVSGSVVSVDGPVTLGPSAHVGGDVRAARSRAGGGRRAGGRRRSRGCHVRPPWPDRGARAVRLLARDLGLGPGSRTVAPALRATGGRRRRERRSRAAVGLLGWGALTFVALPLGGAVAIITLVGLPLGLGLLLALFFLYSIGVSWSAFTLGQVLWPEPHGRVTAFLIGWTILAAVAAIPTSVGSSGLRARCSASARRSSRSGGPAAGRPPPYGWEDAGPARAGRGRDRRDDGRGALVEQEAGQEGVGL